MNLFKRKPKEETVSRAIHDQAMEHWRVIYNRLQEQFSEAERILKIERDAARAEASANAEDAAKYRRSVANLKQNRPRDKQQAEVGA